MSTTSSAAPPTSTSRWCSATASITPIRTPATSCCPTDSTWPSWTSATSDTSAAHGRHQLEALLMALGSRDVDEITDIVIDITHAPADIDTDRLSGQLETWLSRYLGGSVADLDFVGMVNSGMQIMHSNRLTFPSDLALLFRVLVQLQGLGSTVGAKVSLTELLQPYWEQMMHDRLNPVAVGRRGPPHPARLGASTRHGAHEAPAGPSPTPRRNNRCRIPSPRRRRGNRPTCRRHPGCGLYSRLSRTHRPADRSTDPGRVHPRSSRGHRWCGHLATPDCQSRRPPQQPQPHSPARPAVPRACGSPKLDALNGIAMSVRYRRTASGPLWKPANGRFVGDVRLGSVADSCRRTAS